MGRQLRLDLDQVAAHHRADFTRSPANEDALRLLDAWPEWHGRCLALVGPSGSGKTHLAQAWAEEHEALAWAPEADLADVAGRPVLVEDADRERVDEETLFHLINMAGAGGGLLLTGREPPSAWPARLPDLRSRLNALPVAQLGEPDDALLLAVMSKLFRKRHIRAPDDLLVYLLRRMERSVPAARELVARIDEAALSEGRPISRALARELLEDAEDTGDLFD